MINKSARSDAVPESPDVKYCVAESDPDLEHLRRALEQDATLTWDLETGIIFDCNRATSRLTGRERSQLVGERRQALLPLQKDEEDYSLAVARHLEEGGRDVFETQVMTSDGEVRSFAAKFIVIRIGDRRIVQEIIQHITEYEESKKEVSELGQRFNEAVCKSSDIEYSMGQRMQDFVCTLNGVAPGECYLNGSHKTAYKIFADLSLRSFPSLCISRERPDRLMRDYDVLRESIILLSSIPVDGFKAVDSLQDVSINILLFLSKHGKSVVLLDGVEYLISRSDFNTVFRFIQELRFNFVNSNAILLLPIDLATLAEREKALLLSELTLR